MRHDVAVELVGTVLSVDVEVGAQVAAGDTIIILESMKMEIPVQTEFAGTVAEVSVVAKATVMDGDVVAVIEVPDS